MVAESVMAGFEGRLLFLSLVLVVCLTAQLSHGADLLYRSRFPAGFVFGTASSAYQYEGAAFSYGKGPNIWDTYTHKHPERIADKSNGDVATDQYHHVPEDVHIMKDMGLDAYRFSISWARVFPTGKLGGGVNMQGINYYNELIDSLLQKGLKPYVTLFHWDVPQGLEDDYGGFLSPKSVKDFTDFAELCFKHFGDRVKHWITLNEPWSFSSAGYAYGALAPGRCSAWMNLNCTGGNSATEPYIVAHHLLIAHATAVKLYNTEYKAIQKGVIGISLNSYWLAPLTNSTQDVKAAFRYLDFMYGWFMDPVINGYYPRSMRELVGDRLPKFSPAESELVKGSFDFIGLNYYTGNYAAYQPTANGVNASYLTDPLTSLTGERNGVPIGPQPFPGWLYVYPEGLRNLLLYTKTKYRNPPLYITENGMYEFNNLTLPLSQQLADTYRIKYYIVHLYKALRAIKEGVNLKGYFAWSLLDNFEWGSGYTVRFGIYYVDYENGHKRYPKKSAGWFKDFLSK